MGSNAGGTTAVSGYPLCDQNIWLKQYKENYNGISEQAKELEDFIKVAFKGGKYVPWAVMERLLYEQDPNASFTVLTNENGGVVFTDEVIINSFQRDGERVVETSASSFSHQVRVAVTFLGKTVIENYPIQDSKVKGAAYTAPKAYDQNLVNNAQKRGLTKAAARVSGLALKLYENIDLQFDNDDEVANKKTEPVKVIKIEEGKPMGEVVAQWEKETKIDNIADAMLVDLATYLHQNIKELEQGVKLMNTTIFKKYKFTFNLEDTVDEILSKLGALENASKYIAAVKFQSGVK